MEGDQTNFTGCLLDQSDIWSSVDFSSFGNLPFPEDAIELEPPNISQIVDEIMPQLTGTLYQELHSNDIPMIPHESALEHDTLDFAGAYGFSVSFPNRDGGHHKVSSSWTYSDILEELFVRMNKDCPVQVSLGHPVPASTSLRITPIFRRIHDRNEFPIRCLNHSGIEHETNRDHHATEHVIRSYLAGSEHLVDQQTGRMSLLLPYEFVQRNVPYTYVLRFMCRTSCVGGMNRRPFSIVFTLEHNGKCLGRQVKKVHVCAAPRRDCKIEEKRHMRDRSREIQPAHCEETEVTKPKQNSRDTEFIPLAQDIKRDCKRFHSSSDEKTEHTEKPKKKYKIKISSNRVFKILSALQPVLEANMSRKQDTEDSTEDGD